MLDSNTSNHITVCKRMIDMFILSDKSDFNMIDNLSIGIHAFISRILMSFSVDETLFP